MKRKLLLSTLTTLLLLLPACSKNMTRGEASRLITKHLKLPGKIMHYVYVGEYRLMEDAGFYAPDDFYRTTEGSTVKKCVNEGVLACVYTREEQVSLLSGGTGPYRKVFVFTVTPTQKAGPYIVGSLQEDSLRKGRFFNTIVLADVVLNEITGIAQEEPGGKVKIEFTTKTTNLTPFGKCHGVQDGKIEKEVRYARLYDDGWRIEP